MIGTRRYNLVLAIYPNTRGVAFALFEGALSPVDWGISEIRGKAKNRQCIRFIGSLMGRYTPDVLVLQDTSEQGTLRARRIRHLNEAIGVLAETQSIPMVSYSRAQVRACFVALGSPTKSGIAEAITKHIPAFDRFLPPRRKLWTSEDARMGLFDAVALALTFFYARVESAGSVGQGGEARF